MEELDSTFEDELLREFLEEALSNLSIAEECFLNLEKTPFASLSESDREALFDSVFRCFHNLKGGGTAVGLGALAELAHRVESLLTRLQKGHIAFTPFLITLLLDCTDSLGQMAISYKSNPKTIHDNSALEQRIQDQILSTPDSVLSSDRYEFSMKEAGANEESHTSRMPITPDNSPFQPEEERIRIRLSRLDHLMDNVGELVILKSVLAEQLRGIESTSLQKTFHQFQKLSRELQDISMRLRMVPIRPTFVKMRRIVRDISSYLKKNIDLEVEGEDTEIDKTVLEKIDDPLMHLIRNAIDHGIEPESDRIALGKPPHGTIRLSAAYNSDHIVLELSDDGRGLDIKRISQKAVELGLMPQEHSLTDKEIGNFIFSPGFSTKIEVSEVSGRGVGLDVVKANIGRLNGRIEIDTTPGKGSVFRIALPLTLGIIEGAIVRALAERYIIPVGQIQETLRYSATEVREIPGRGRFLILRGDAIPLHSLAGLLGGHQATDRGENTLTLIVRHISHPAVAITVDELIGRQMVVTKRLGRELSHLKVFSGSAILGDGKPALVLDLHEVTLNDSTTPSHPPRVSPPGEATA